MIEQGDGTFAERLARGHCPRCQTALPPFDVHGRIQCSVCDLVIAKHCTEEQACDSDTADKAESVLTLRRER